MLNKFGVIYFYSIKLILFVFRIRRDDKICMKTSAVHSVVATQNWIIKSSHYAINIAHQSDTALIAVQVGIHKKNTIHLFIHFNEKYFDPFFVE